MLGDRRQQQAAAAKKNYLYKKNEIDFNSMRII